MTTSGTISATLVARQIVTRAMQKLVIVALGETPTSDEMTDGVTELGLMLKSWQTDVNLWREEELTLTATTPETTLDPRCIDVIEARLATPYERPLARWEWGHYLTIPTKAQVGSPSCYTVRKQRDSLTLLLWPAPSVSRPASIIYTAARVIEDVTDPEQTIDVPQEWLEAIVLQLAGRLAPSYGESAMSAYAGFAPRAELLLTQMRDLDRPASYSMGAYR